AASIAIFFIVGVPLVYYRSTFPIMDRVFAACPASHPGLSPWHSKRRFRGRRGACSIRGFRQPANSANSLRFGRRRHRQPKDMMQFIDLGAQRERIGDRLKAAIDGVVADGRYILGPQVAEFEKRLADYVGARHMIACANGTDALMLPLMAHDIGPGDAVFCPAFTFAATAEAVALRRPEPVFVDVEPGTYNIDPASLDAAIAMVIAEGRLKPRAVIPVDLFGLAANYPAIAAIADRHGLVVIEDAAQSIGGKLGNGMCGSFGHVA